MHPDQGVLETDRMWDDISRFVRFIAPLEKIIGYQFKNKALLREALTLDRYWQGTVVHSQEQRSCRRLAFLGDRTLSFIATQWLYEKRDPEAERLHRFDGLMSETRRLAKCAGHLGMEFFIMPACFSSTQRAINPEATTTALEAVIGAWSLDDPSLRSLTDFLVLNIFSLEELEEDLATYGLSAEEMARLKAGYPSLWIAKLKSTVWCRLGSTFRLDPRIRGMNRVMRDGFWEHCAGFFLGEHQLLEERARANKVAKRYALFRCALRILDGDEWIREIIARDEINIESLAP